MVGWVFGDDWVLSGGAMGEDFAYAPLEAGRFGQVGYESAPEKMRSGIQWFLSLFSTMPTLAMSNTQNLGIRMVTEARSIAMK